MKARLATLLVAAAVASSCTVAPNPVVPDEEYITEPIERANALSGQVSLDQGLRAAMAFFAESGTMSGFTPEEAKAYDPSTTFNTSPTAAEGQVSIRVVSPTAVVLVTKDGSGAIACKAFDGATGAITSGTTDAATVEDCS